MKRTIKITDRFKKKAGCRKNPALYWRTDKGDMTTKKLAKYLGVEPGTITQWFRKGGEDVNSPYFQAKISGKKPPQSSTKGAANWEGLSKDDRPENFNGLKEPGTFERG